MVIFRLLPRQVPVTIIASGPILPVIKPMWYVNWPFWPIIDDFFQGWGIIASLYQVGYVTQSDFLLPFLTVKETLLFVAKLRMGLGVSAGSKMDRVSSVILDLGLKVFPLS